MFYALILALVIFLVLAITFNKTKPKKKDVYDRVDSEYGVEIKKKCVELNGITYEIYKYDPKRYLGEHFV